MKINKVFVSGKMNKDADERYLKNGDYRDATNIRVLSSEGSDAGTVENVQGNNRLSYLKLANQKSMGSYADHKNEKIYWFINSDTLSGIVEYHTTEDEIAWVLQENNNNVLDLKRIKGVNLIDGNLFWIDGNNVPRCINIQYAKEKFGTDGADWFTEKEIKVIKPPPLAPPTIKLIDNGTEENNLKEKFLSFSYRYKYLHGYHSALSPFTDVAFTPENFKYDFSTGTNDSMVNRYNSVEITFDIQDYNITDVELVFKESGSSVVYVIENFNKERLWLGEHSVDKTFTFDNSKIDRILPEDEINRIFDNVPLSANVQESVGNRIMYGDYIEHYDITRADESEIEIDYSLSLVSNNVQVPVPKKSLKSNRDLELGLNYLDNDGRITTSLSSKTNTIFIPHSTAIKQNKLRVTIENDPPSWATKYRWFVKQSKVDYETLVPNRFHQDGAFTWVKLDAKDKDKIIISTFLIIKADMTGVLSTLRETEVLDLKEHERNFLEDDGETLMIQEAGLYYKIKADNFSLNFSEADTTFNESHDNSNHHGSFYRDEVNYIEPAVFYETSSLNDLTASGVYNPVDNLDKRVHIDIFSIGDNATTWNTYQFSLDDGDTWDDNTGAGYIITVGTPQAIADGLEIEFGSNWGHEIDDYWVISCKDKDDGLLDIDNADFYPSKAYGVYRGVNGDKIYGNAAITFYYHERGDVEIQYEKTFTVSRTYANIEEWWYGDNIALTMPSLQESHIWFRRGYFTQGDKEITFYQDLAYPVCLVIKSDGTQNNRLDSTSKIWTRFKVQQSSEPIIFETKPKDLNSDIFYEIGETYEIINGKHQGNVHNQGDWGVVIDHPTNPVYGIHDDALSELEIFNCFSFGNGFESYKIKDVFNNPSFKMDTRPMLVYNEYKQIHKFASITYGGVFNKSTDINNLNEFNLSLANFKDLDEHFGAIGVIHNDVGDVLVIQEDATSRILYNKKILYDVEGKENVTATNVVLGSQRYFVGEYGISLDTETFASRGSRKYWVDSKRGCVCRLGQSGIEEISRHGMFDWFKDILNDNTFTFKTATYDPFYDEYLLHILTTDGYRTLSFNEVPKGWTSFYTFEPELMIPLNNGLFSFKKGELYEHHSNDVPRQEFYGECNDFNITFVVNDAPNMDKVFKTFNTESTIAFDIELKTNYTNGCIYTNEFIKKESWYYSDIKKSEDEDDLTGLNANGIGTIHGFFGSQIAFINEVGSNISIGDLLWMQFAENDVREVGTITAIDGKLVTVDAVVNTLTDGKFVYATKNSRVEGSEIRGYFLEAKLISDNQNPAELNGVNINAVLSNV